MWIKTIYLYFSLTGKSRWDDIHLITSHTSKYHYTSIHHIDLINSFFISKGISKCSCSLYVCVCLYSSTVKVSSDCKMSKTCLRGTDQRSSVVNIPLGPFCQVPSSLFSNLSYFTSKGVTPASRKTGEKTIWYNGILRKDDIYRYRI